ncbi:MAG: double zinc ribbon domain-containing protein [Holosporales bacterium]|nr:double zinc ribbon domain-containing protein [Holosporales bacterium]
MFDWLFPRCCYICRTEISPDAMFCAKCFSELVFIDSPICSRCGKLLPTPNSLEEYQICVDCSVNDKIHFDAGRALLLYNDLSRRIIFQIKKRADIGATRTCVRMLVIRFGPIVGNADLIIPVPSHWTQNLIRGYNPPSIIANELSKLLGIQVDNSLKRIRKTESQSNKTIAERIENVNSAFSYQGRLTGQRILLVDDVRTTGATLNECARILKLTGASFITCITIATTSIKDTKI